MIHASAIAESIVAPTLFRPEFLHSLGQDRTLAVLTELEHWSLTTLREKLLKIGAEVVSHARCAAFQLAEVPVPRNLYREILRLIDDLRPAPLPP